MYCIVSVCVLGVGTAHPLSFTWPSSVSVGHELLIKITMGTMWGVFWRQLDARFVPNRIERPLWSYCLIIAKVIEVLHVSHGKVREF